MVGVSSQSVSAQKHGCTLQAVAGEGIRSPENTGELVWSAKSVYDTGKGTGQGEGSPAAEKAQAAAPSPLKGNDAVSTSSHWAGNAPGPAPEEAGMAADSAESTASVESSESTEAPAPSHLAEGEVASAEDLYSISSTEEAHAPTEGNPAEATNGRVHREGARRKAKTGWRLPKPRVDGSGEAPEEAQDASGPSVGDETNAEDSPKPSRNHRNPVDNGFGGGGENAGDVSQQKPTGEDPDVSGWAVAPLDPYGNPWPVAPPFTTNKFVRPPPLADLVKIAPPRVNVAPISGGIVKTDGTHFKLDGKIEYFVGKATHTIKMKLACNPLQVLPLSGAREIVWVQRRGYFIAPEGDYSDGKRYGKAYRLIC
jgi:hypothetical protein